MQTTSAPRIAVVTGGNKGIGFAICKLLAKRGIKVILGARNPELGMEAAKKLQQYGPVEYFHLDLENRESMEKMAEHLQKNYSGFDILVNNAGIAFKGSAFDADVAKKTLGVNYFGTLHVLETLLPVMRDGGRVVNVSSGAGNLSSLSKKLQSQFLDPQLTKDGLSNLMQKFIVDVEANKFAEEGWPRQAYGVSKIGVTALTRVLAKQKEYQDRGILINSMCPGWVKTDMSGMNSAAPQVPDDVAPLAVWLSTIPQDPKLSGKFFKGIEKETKWEST